MNIEGMGQPRKRRQVIDLVDSASAKLELELLSQGGGEIAAAHEEQIDAAGGGAAFGDGPDDQRLAALHVASGENAGDAGHPVRIAPDVAALGEFHSQLFEHPYLLRAEEAHGEQDEIGFDLHLGAGDVGEGEAALRVLAHLDLDRVELFHPAILAGELLGREIGRAHV